MLTLRKLLASLVILLPGATLNSPAVAFDNRVDAQLVSETDRLSPGTSSRIALRLNPKPGWHVYWSNPGDSGMPPRISWTLPAGLKISELRHPAPEAKDAAGFVSYVHPGDVALLADIRVPSSMPTGTPLTLIANVQWLTCSDNMCVPENAKLTLDLAVGTGIGNRTNGKLFDVIEQALPRRLSHSGVMREDGGTIEIEFSNSMIDASTARLFPDDQTFDAAAPQSVRRDGGKIIFTIPSKKPLPSSFSGVITSRGSSRGFAVTAKRQNVPAPIIETVDIPAAQMIAVAPAASKLPPGIPSTGIPASFETKAAPMKPVVDELPPRELERANFIPALLGAVIGGLLLNLMPCVFPILSLKALSLVRSGASERAARIEAVTYTVGAIIVCGALGAGLLALRAAGSEVGWAFQLQNPYVILGLAALMATISFNLIGFFELPSFSVGGGLLMREGAQGAFWTGALTAFIATPCSGPFMGLAIGAALVLPAPAALAIFVGLGFGLALPFLAIGTIPSLRSKLPRPGAWMVRLRKFLAIPMLLTSGALIWILGRQTGLTGFFVGAFAFAACGAALSWAGRRQIARSGVLVPIASLAALLLIAAAMLPAPRATARAEITQFQKPFSESELARLRNDGIPVFVDFTADWCLTCKVNEKVGIDTELTRGALRDAGVVTLIGDWTNSDPEISKFLAKNGRNSIPFYLYYAPGKAPVVLPQILGPKTLSEVVKN
jgi:thiol:disulfide interchange protein/DsbC/DsbD-like thiol-disulfide interchange protein